MKKKSRYDHGEQRKIGTPFDPFGQADSPDKCSMRIVPSPFDYPAYPMGFSLIRNVEVSK